MSTSGCALVQLNRFNLTGANFNVDNIFESKGNSEMRWRFQSSVMHATNSHYLPNSYLSNENVLPLHCSSFILNSLIKGTISHRTLLSLSHDKNMISQISYIVQQNCRFLLFKANINYGPDPITESNWIWVLDFQWSRIRPIVCKT